MSKRIGTCEGCGLPVYIGEPFDLEMRKWRVVFSGSIRPGGRMVIWHRACNPHADHSKDGKR